ncbi:UDP-2,3-diacylglucosamine diphosphatase [Planctomyces sp. SH-PL62]|uniref:UDP-2,3-diacylglucosamine diphosphatase n=1 Tax=Planctomyces sp. SH-PL62 TaxID=1636152 RepID=UPI00078B2090|nr:metallophosphoesterase [Planctomyces sp. SH-PL62]AMV39645.1 UDP-2,3-diacylglucosamine hydrolase [Planctomyces sp. SH-PL62]
MSDYFLSDVHLREDRPERGRRLLRFLDRLESGDRLLIAGDLCDFWMGSRLSSGELARDPALEALAVFRAKGGDLSILPGNHDAWLVPFYQDRLGAAILTEPVEVESHGLRLHIVHGHLLGARRKWKAALESREFFRGFGMLPGPAAGVLDRILESKNRRGLEADELRHLTLYRDYADGLEDAVDLAVFGHVHRPVDQPGRPRMIVLGGWQNRSSFLKIDPSGASFHIEERDPDDDAQARTGRDLNPSETNSVS